MSSERQAFNDGFDKGYSKALDKIAQLEAAVQEGDQRFSDLQDENQRLREQYHELLFNVGKKHPDETRHETALRYIQEAERGSTDALKDGKYPTKSHLRQLNELANDALKEGG